MTYDLFFNSAHRAMLFLLNAPEVVLLSVCSQWDPLLPPSASAPAYSPGMCKNCRVLGPNLLIKPYITTSIETFIQIYKLKQYFWLLWKQWHAWFLLISKQFRFFHESPTWYNFSLVIYVAQNIIIFHFILPFFFFVFLSLMPTQTSHINIKKDRLLMCKHFEHPLTWML